MPPRPKANDVDVDLNEDFSSAHEPLLDQHDGTSKDDEPHPDDGEIGRFVVGTTIFFVVPLTIYLIYALVAGVPLLPQDRPERKYSIYPEDFALSLPLLYPELASGASTQCSAAWESLDAVPCVLETVLGSWDYGMGAARSSLESLVPRICETKCTKGLETAQKLIASACIGEDDIFEEGGSRWPVERENEVVQVRMERSPTVLLDVLVERQLHTCRKAGTFDEDSGFCMLDMVSTWGIVDGIRSDGMLGIDEFLRATNEKYSEEEHYHNGRKGSSCYSAKKKKCLRPRRDIGPGAGETTCSECTLLWLEDKVSRRKPNKDKTAGDVFPLPYYLAAWERAGQRCPGDRFDTAFKKAVNHYQDQGLLQPDWRDHTDLEEHAPHEYSHAEL